MKPNVKADVGQKVLDEIGAELVPGKTVLAGSMVRKSPDGTDHTELFFIRARRVRQ